MPSSDAAYAYGIYTNDNAQGEVRGNRVRGLESIGAGYAVGIYNLTSTALTLRDNVTVGDGRPGGIGIRCTSAVSRAIGNVQYQFETPIHLCTDIDNSD